MSKKTSSSGSSKIRNPKSEIRNSPLVAVIMGSKSDWETMRHADETLTEFGVAHECHVMSAHRTPQTSVGVFPKRRHPAVLKSSLPLPVARPTSRAS